MEKVQNVEKRKYLKNIGKFKIFRIKIWNNYKMIESFFPIVSFQIDAQPDRALSQSGRELITSIWHSYNLGMNIMRVFL